MAGKEIFFSISFKLLLSFLVVALVPAGVIAYYLLGEMTLSVDRLELARLEDSQDRAVRAFQRNGGQVLSNNTDYSHWDDVYFPETSHDPEWQKINLTDWVPAHFGIDSIWMTDRLGDVFYTYNVPSELSLNVSSLPQFKDAMEGREGWGIVPTSRGPTIISAGFVTKTEETLTPIGDSPGTLIYGRDIDNEVADDIYQVVGRDIAFFDTEKLIAASDENTKDKIGTPFADISFEARRRISHKQDYLDRTPDYIYFYSPLLSSTGEVLGAMRIGQDQNTANYIRSQISRSLGRGAIIGVLITIASGLFLGLRLSKPIKNLARIMLDYGAGKRVEMPKDSRRDEIGVLTRSYISMVQSLEDSKKVILLRDKELEDTNRNLSATSGNLVKAKSDLEKKIKEVERVNQMMIGRELRMVELKKEIADLKVKLGYDKKGGSENG